MPIDIAGAVKPYVNYFDGGGTTTPTKSGGNFWDTLGNITNTVGNLFQKSDGTPLFDLNKIVKLPTVDVAPDPGTKKTINMVLIGAGVLVLVMLMGGGKRRRR